MNKNFIQGLKTARIHTAALNLLQKPKYEPNMNQSIQEAAKKWFDSLPTEQYHFRKSVFYNTPNIGTLLDYQIDLWIKEVVMPWWNKQHFSFVNLITATHPKGVTPEIVAEFYLQEHKEKEEPLTQEVSEEDGDIEGLVAHDIMEIKSGLFTDFGEQERVVPETVEEAAIIKDLLYALKWARQFMTFHDQANEAIIRAEKYLSETK